MNNDDRGQSRKWLPFLCIWYDLTFGNSIVTHQRRIGRIVQEAHMKAAGW